MPVWQEWGGKSNKKKYKKESMLIVFAIQENAIYCNAFEEWTEHFFRIKNKMTDSGRGGGQIFH